MQEDYFSKIVDRFQRSRAGPWDGDALEGILTSLSLNGNPEKPSNGIDHGIGHGTTTMATSKLSPQLRQHPGELAIILMAMRRIREGIVASARNDAFALRVYTFIIRATISLRHMESYHPALLHLLHRIHLVTPLSITEFHEFIGYYVLDLACRQGDLAAAYKARSRYNFKDSKVEALLKALVHGNWYIFWQTKKLMNEQQKRLISWSEESVQAHSLGCIGKSYLNVDIHFLESTVQEPWPQVRERHNLGWQLERDVVKIRGPKRK